MDKHIFLENYVGRLAHPPVYCTLVDNSKKGGVHQKYFVMQHVT